MPRPRRSLFRRIAFSGAAFLLLSTACVGCWSVSADHIPFLTPDPPAFPDFADRNAVIAEAQRQSDALEAHIRAWFDGKASADLPANLLPPGVDLTTLPKMTLVKADAIRPEEQWAIREAAPVNSQALHGSFPDPHCTYLVLPFLYAPFGTKVVLEGEFPHCRFFDIQVTPSFQPENIHYAGWAGVGEIPLVDVDIQPLPGHTNPFRVGANRNAPKRGYKVTIPLAIGDPVKLNPAFRPPDYRAPGNERVGGALLYQGPWGDPKSKPWGHGRGKWDIGNLWLRYYAPDIKAGPLGGVPLPRVAFVLPDGRRFYLKTDLNPWRKVVNRTRPAHVTRPEEPSALNGPEVGWGKQFGIFRAIVGGLASVTHFGGARYVRELDRGVLGRGPELPPPGNFEPSATTCTYINYLNRSMALGKGKVVVLTGTMPVIPTTLNGDPVMKGGQARYWSLTGYDIALPEADGFAGAAMQTVMDEDVTLDAQWRYVIVMSRAGERPKNATAAHGVTWVNWGPTSVATWTMRWLSVVPEWSFEKTPHEKNLGWESEGVDEHYNRALVGENNSNGFLGEYQTVVHYMTREAFETLGDHVTAEKVPVWRK